MLQFSRYKITVILLTCLFFMLAALPNILSQQQRDALPNWLFQDGVNLGLDLRGGVHLVLQLDFDVYYIEQLYNLRDATRAALRKERIGYRKLSIRDDAVNFEVRRNTLKEDTSIKALLRAIDPDAEVTEQGDNITLRYTEEKQDTMRREVLEQSVEIVNRRINETGTKEPTIQRQGNDRVLVQVPGLTDPEMLKNILGKTAKMTFHLVNETVTPDQIISGIMPPGTRLLPSDDPTERFRNGTPASYPVYRKVALSGELLTNASATYSEGQPVVSFQFNSLGAQKFGDITAQNVGKRFAVVLDDQVITAPVIRVPILGGSGIIEGNFTVETANQLALLLRAGALPAPLDIIEERTVGPSLGADSIAAGKNAALIAVATVIIFMIIAYGLFGLFSAAALLINLIIVVGVLSLLQATLTLPGIAGIVLTLGMAVDANVLIFERIREEKRTGKSIIAAIDTGFRAAFGTIIDSNLTTLIAAIILFAFGSGTIKGFAVTLSIGIISSMFTAILFTRMLVVIWLRRTKPQALPI